MQGWGLRVLSEMENVMLAASTGAPRRLQVVDRRHWFGTGGGGPGERTGSVEVAACWGKLASAPPLSAVFTGMLNIWTV